MFENAEEDVLDYVFGLGAVAEDGVGDAKEQRGIGGNEGVEGSFCGDTAGFGWKRVGLRGGNLRGA